MRISTLILGAVLAAAPLTAVLADERGKEVEAFMDEYLRLWNAHDAAAVTGSMYRFSDKANPMQSVAGLQANFDELKAQGYDHSTKASIEGCLLSSSSALAEMRFTRWKTDGTPLGPKDRVSLYQLRKFPDGWRIIQMIPMSLTAHLNCKSATE